MDITVKFVDFWPTFDVNDNKFVRALRTRHNVRVINEGVPDVLFFSRGEKCEHLKYDCLKVYFTGENNFPDFNECDYALSFYDCDVNGRNLRYPLYMLYEYDELYHPFPIEDKKAVERGFCSLLMRNSTNCDARRLEIVDAVQSYRPIAYGGPFRNNVGGPVDSKLDFIYNYKFNLALENSIVDGYVTEKIVEPMAASTVPIYWGSDMVKSDFNPDAFINVNDFADSASLIKYIAELDTDHARYLEILRAPKLVHGVTPDFDSRLADFLDKIVTRRKRYVVRYGEMNTLHERNVMTASMLNNKWLRRAAKIIGRLRE